MDLRMSIKYNTFFSSMKEFSEISKGLMARFSET